MTLEHAHCLGSVLSTTMAPGLVITSKPEVAACGATCGFDYWSSGAAERRSRDLFAASGLLFDVPFHFVVKIVMSEETEHLSAADRTFFDVAVMVVIVAFPASAVRTPVAEIGCIHVLSSRRG